MSLQSIVTTEMETYKNGLSLISMYIDQKKSKKEELFNIERMIDNERRKIPKEILEYFDGICIIEKLKETT